jgi:chromo domain-containing protein 1
MQRSDLEAKREAAAYTSDVGTSLDDSEASCHESSSEYDADDIFAQCIHAEEDGGEVLLYLVKFTDYPIHRQVMSTGVLPKICLSSRSEWLAGPKISKALREKWRKKRSEMTAVELDEICKKNGAEFRAGVERAAAAKQRRHQKREQLRQEAARKTEESLKQRHLAETKAPTTQDHAVLAKDKGKHAVSPKTKRRLVTSSSDEDTFEATSDSESSSSENEPLFQTQAISQSRSDRTEHGTNARVVSRPSSPQQRRRSLAGAGSSINNPSSEGAPSAAAGSKPSVPTGPTVNNRQDGPRAPGAIKIVNEPKQFQRKAWDTHGKHFNTLHFRAVAEKRSRVEGTPDINELEFVNGCPAGVPTKSVGTMSRAPAHSNPYGRREPGQLRLLEDDSDDSPGVALQSYEMGKHPMECFDWKHGSCPYGGGSACLFACEHYANFTPLMCVAEQCRFLHRTHGPDGEPLPTTTWDGKVPPKYRTPPQTCRSWFSQGECRFSEKECVFAHKNTGHLPIGEGNTMPIDTHIENGSAAARGIGGLPKYPDVTCVHWLMDTKGCSKGSDQCIFAHRNTGILGNINGADFRPIDPKQKPVNARNPPKYQDPPQTCFFWLRGQAGCQKSADTCNYAHTNTGWLAQMLANQQHSVLQIDPHERPRYEAAPRLPSFSTSSAFTNAPVRYIPLHKKTCFFWNEATCRKSEETCRGLHRYTGMVADPPRTWIAPPGWQPHLRDEPVPTRVHKPILTENDESPPTHFDVPFPTQVDEPVEEARNGLVSESLDRRGDGSRFTRHTDFSVEESPPLSPQEHGGNRIGQIQPAEAIRKIEEVMPLDLDDMLRCNGDQCEDVIAGPNALILFDPAEHKTSTEMLERWLAMNYMKVFSPLRIGFDAAWNGFKQLILDGGSGIIIAHPEYEDYASLPGFGDMLRGTVRLWSVGYQPGADYNMWDPNASTETPYDRFSIFPHGGVIYITDDVFEKQPQLALTMFEHFFAKIEAGRNVDSDVTPGMYVNDGILLWRLGVRPELMKWIYDICMNHQAEIDEGDPDYVR